MKKIAKTNAARLLDAAAVQYELIPYEVDESDESLKTKLYGKRAVLSMIDKRYLITEIF